MLIILLSTSDGHFLCNKYMSVQKDADIREDERQRINIGHGALTEQLELLFTLN